jgi:hypothetical protein
MMGIMFDELEDPYGKIGKHFANYTRFILHNQLPVMKE